ncbi:hypothetical protein B0T10DRAFT_566265 [Thelonectria olida]|uniref:Mid2 domain-containing protein n=1 Tax=Thelonectria olida TaxID=1576542 RepID=A0A9P8VV17_9HYPO|nr:hypothetical protein B0T10DRAFT_566265 [Thelonectria olida]
MAFYVLIILLLLFATDGLAVFLRPPGPGPIYDYRDNPVYQLGQDLDMEWEVNYDKCNMTLVQLDVVDPSGETAFKLPKAMAHQILENYTSETYTWTVSFDGFPDTFNPGLGNIYYFRMDDADDEERPEISHYFNITDPAAATTTGTPTADPTSGATGSWYSGVYDSGSTPGTASPSNGTVASGHDHGECLSKSALVGISVGATIGALAVMAGLAFLVWRVLRGNSESPSRLSSKEPMLEPTLPTATVAANTPFQPPFHVVSPISPHAYHRQPPWEIYEAP